MLSLILGNEIGASFNDINLDQSVGKFPKEKTQPGEYNSKLKTAVLKYNIKAILAVNDEILGMNIPEGAKIQRAEVFINGSTGAGGIFDFGLKAGQVYDEDSSNEDKLEAFAEDQNALVNQADAGGSAVRKTSDQLAVLLGGMNKKVGKGGLQMFVKVTEATTTTVATPRELEAIVTYSLEF